LGSHLFGEYPSETYSKLTENRAGGRKNVYSTGKLPPEFLDDSTATTAREIDVVKPEILG